MKFVFPRVIKGNRGDIASRWLLLRSLSKLGVEDYVVFGEDQNDFPPEIRKMIPYGKFRNLVPTFKGWNALKKADAILWSVGLDLQDDSSLLKLVYLYLLFSSYRWLGLKIFILFQGAGPLQTNFGRFFARNVLQQVDCFIARDPQTLDLVKEINPSLHALLGHDAIFFSDISVDLNTVASDELAWIEKQIDNEQITVAFNLRQWFHFSSDILPYMFLRQKYQARSEKEMRKLTDRSVQVLEYIRNKYQARILLLSAYQPGIEPWEDDLKWLKLIKKRFASDPEVLLIEKGISMAGYYTLLSKLNLVIGMRLHTTLISLRLGIPSINISYTLKGESILKYLGLDAFVLNLEEFLSEPKRLFQKIDLILVDEKEAREEIVAKVHKAISLNNQVLTDFLNQYGLRT